jgi:hypothetical protein
MHLNDLRILRLAKNLKKVIITKKIKAWELASLLFQKVIKCLLAAF